MESRPPVEGEAGIDAVDPATIAVPAPRGRWTVLLAAAAAMTVVVTNVAHHTLGVVQAQSLLPQWDLAAHLEHGWVDHHYFATGQIHRLLWDLWLQGYWPPLLSIVQIPFYLMTGGEITGGLWSTLVTFVAVGVTGSAILGRLFGMGGLLPASGFVALLISSPFLLAYSSVTMTETLGALTQLIVVYAYVAYRQRPTATTARWFAVSLSLLFFTKYNYFLLLIGPLVIHEWLEFTAGHTLGRRIRDLVAVMRRVLTSPMGMFLTLSALAVMLILQTGGFEYRVWGQRISVRGIGNAGNIVLYIVLARLCFLHARGRINWTRLASLDLRVRPLLVWFVAPVTFWLASPYPNHLRDFFNLVVNRPMGEATVGEGLSVYVDALRTSYFYNEWVLTSVLVVFFVAVLNYRRHTSAIRWLILAVPLQLIAIVVHQTRFPRFLLLTAVLLCLVAAAEIGRWCVSAPRRRLAGALMAPMVLIAGLMTSREVMNSARFRTFAFELYTDSAPLKAALSDIRAGLTPGDRLAVVGQSNELSPALFAWQLGPPSGSTCFPIALTGARRQDVGSVTQVLLLEGAGPNSPLDDVSYYWTQREAVLARVERGELALRQEFLLPDVRVRMRLYDRTNRTAEIAACP